MDLDDLDDPFGDDDFDDLPAATLQHIEQQARLSTQHGSANTARRLPDATSKPSISRVARSRTTHQLPSSDYGFGTDDDVIDLDAQPSFVQQQYNGARTKPIDDVTRREEWRQERYGQTIQHRQRPGFNRKEAPGSVQAEHGSVQNGDAGASGNDHGLANGVEQHGDVQALDVATLQARVQELEEHARSLQQAAEEARSAAYSKNGEVAIVRANQQREAQEYERKFKALQQQHADEVARSRVDLEVARKEREKFETNNRFLEHDLAREAERARNVRRTLKDVNGNAARSRLSPVTTPRKNRTMPLRDGFEDSDIVSPSKQKVKTKAAAASPNKVGAKRKRPGEEDHAPSSPMLSFSDAEAMVHGDSNPATPRAASFSAPVPPLQTSSDEKLRFVQSIIDHRTRDGQYRTLEVLTKFHLPSASNVSLASTIYDRLTFSALQAEFDQFRLQVCDVLLSQWEKCLAEKYYDPLHDLTELFQYILVISPASLSVSLMARTVPLCQGTTDLIAVATAKAYIDPGQNVLPTRTLKGKVDTVRYLDLLHFTAIQPTLVLSRTETNPTSLNDLWSNIEFDFVLTILHRAQPLEHMSSMLELLQYSILPSSFGSISPDPTRQKQMESNLVDRLTKLLFEDPQHARPLPREEHYLDFMRKEKIETEEYERGALPVPEPYTVLELLIFRSTVLELLFALALSEHGGQLLAIHNVAIGRFVRYMHESVVKLYTSYNGGLPAGDEKEGNDAAEEDAAPRIPEPGLVEDGYSLHARHINTVVTILYRLNSTYGTLSTLSQDNSTQMRTAQDDSRPAPILDIHAYLESQPSASQAYLVALSRIAFSEGWGLEVGIEAEVAEMAHDMLDEFVSPEDGEGVLGVFESGRTTTAPATAI